MKVLKTVAALVISGLAFISTISRTFAIRLKGDEIDFTYEQCIFGVCTYRRVYRNGNEIIQLDCSARHLRKLNIFSLQCPTTRKSFPYRDNVMNSGLSTQIKTETLDVLSEIYKFELNLRMNNLQTILDEFHGIDRNEAENINILDLSYNRLKHINTNAFTTLSGLKSLSLRYNRIATIPNLSMLPDLQMMDLQNNFFLKVVPGSHMPRTLTHLYFAYTPIQHIGRELLRGQNGLGVLDISNGLGTQIRQRTIACDAFDDLNNLTTLNISFTTWGKNSISTRHFENLNNLKILKARRCYLKSFKPFINGTGYGSNSLEELDVTGNRFNAEKLTNGNFPKLQKLYLNYTIIKNLPTDAFESMPQLQELHISGVRLLDSSVGILDNNPTIKYLDISHNRLQNLPVLSPILSGINLRGNKLTIVWRKVFFQANSLSVLDLSDQRIATIEEFAFDDNVTNQVKNLESLNLKGNKLQAVCRHQFTGLENLIELNLEENSIWDLESLSLPKLTNLNLSKNKIKVTNTQVFNALPSLSHLDLSSNEMFLIEAGTGLHTLQFLNLNENNLTLSTTLPPMENLQYLSLEYNNITEMTSQTFGNCCQSLTTLKVAHNNMQNVANGSFQYMHNLTELDLSYNKFGFQSFQAFEDLQGLTKLKSAHSKLKEFINVRLASLKHLDLQENRLVSLGNIPIFDLMPNIEFLELNSNDITHITPGLLDGLSYLKKISLKYNDFRCPCQSDGNIYADSYNYAKKWLLTFAHSEQADSSMLKEIEADKINPVPTYFCTKENSEMMQLFNEPCQQGTVDILQQFLEATNLIGYEGYLSSIMNETNFSGDDNGSSASYDYGDYGEY